MLVPGGDPSKYPQEDANEKKPWILHSPVRDQSEEPRTSSETRHRHGQTNTCCRNSPSSAPNAPEYVYWTFMVRPLSNLVSCSLAWDLALARISLASARAAFSVAGHSLAHTHSSLSLIIPSAIHWSTTRLPSTRRWSSEGNLHVALHGVDGAGFVGSETHDTYTPCAVCSTWLHAQAGGGTPLGLGWHTYYAPCMVACIYVHHTSTKGIGGFCWGSCGAFTVHQCIHMHERTGCIQPSRRRFERFSIGHRWGTRWI